MEEPERPKGTQEAKPDQEPEVAEADVAEADVVEVEVAEAEVAEADVVEVQVAEAEVAEAEVAEAEVAEADAAEADAVEVEVDEAEFSNEEQEMADLLAQSEMRSRRPRRGDLIEGVVVSIDREGIVVDIGTKIEAFIPSQEMGVDNDEPELQVKPGDPIVARVVDPNDEAGRTVLSLAQAQEERGWRTAEQTASEGHLVEARVVEANRGGLVVTWHSVRGFVPLSQLTNTGPRSDEPIETRLESRRGERLTLKILEVNHRRNRLILSERAAEQERRALQRDRLIEELQAGEIRKGRVRSLADFGAFVDLGGADGLIHISELAWASVSHPSEVLHVGDEVEVLILGVDRAERRISLSRKRMQPEPWATVPERYVVGQVVQTRVKKLATFGAFVEIEPGVEGLIHISELSDQRIQHPKNIVDEGDVVSAKIIRIDPERRRLGLSLRQAIEEAEAVDWRSASMVYGGPAETVGETLDLMEQMEPPPRPDEEEAAPVLEEDVEPEALETEPDLTEDDQRPEFVTPLPNPPP